MNFTIVTEIHKKDIVEDFRIIQKGCTFCHACDQIVTRIHKEDIRENIRCKRGHLTIVAILPAIKETCGDLTYYRNA